MVSYPQPYPIVTHQSPTHGVGGGPGSQCRDSIGMGHVTRQVKLISAAVTHSTSTDSLYTTRLPDNLGPIRSGPDSRSRTVTRYCNKENIRRMTLQLCYFRSRGNILRFPLWTTAAHLCQLHHTLSSSTRRSTNFQTPPQSLIASPFDPPMVLRLPSVPARMPARPARPGHYLSPGLAPLRPWPCSPPPDCPSWPPAGSDLLLSTLGLPIWPPTGLGSTSLT